MHGPMYIKFLGAFLHTFNAAPSSAVQHVTDSTATRFLPLASRPTASSNPSPVQRVPDIRGPSPGETRPGNPTTYSHLLLRSRMYGAIPPTQTAQRLIKHSDDFTLGYCRRPAVSDRGQWKMCRYLVRGSRAVSDHSTAVLTWKDGINLKNSK